MADEKKPEPLTAESVPSLYGGISALASANAPFVYFDAVPAYSWVPGVGMITLTATRAIGPLVGGAEGQVATDQVITGLLRANFVALRSLRDTIDELLKKVEAAAWIEPPVADDGHPSPTLN